MKRYFIDNHMSYCYPYETSQKVTDYGVLSQYMGKMFDRNEIDRIICELITRHPYIEYSMSLVILVNWIENNVTGFYHMLSFKNDNCDKQSKGSMVIKYEK